MLSNRAPVDIDLSQFVNFIDYQFWLTNKPKPDLQLNDATFKIKTPDLFTYDKWFAKAGLSFGHNYFHVQVHFRTRRPSTKRIFLTRKKCIYLYNTNVMLTVHLILPFCCRLSSSNSEKAESSSRGFILCGDKYGTYEWKKKKKKRSLSKSLHIIFVCRWFRRFFLYGHSTKNLQHKMWKRSNLSRATTIEVKNGRKFLQSVWTR